MTAACRSCGAPIEFAFVQTIGGKTRRMPLDPGRRDDGNIAVHVDHTGTLRGRTLPKGDHPARHETPRVSHFATCPSAGQHRRAKPSQRSHAW